jgi:polar amino acid transport system permease protein
VQLYLIYYAIPQVGIKLDALTASVIAFELNSAAYQAEYWRAALNSVPRTQWEAALSLGLSKWKALRKVIVPQAWRVVMPALTNELVYLLKYSSLAAFVTLPELVYTGSIIAAKTFMYVEVYSLIAVIYVIIAMAVSEGLGLVERRHHIPGLGTRVRG